MQEDMAKDIEELFERILDEELKSGEVKGLADRIEDTLENIRG